MKPELLLDLSTRLMHDLKTWSEEATARNAITPEELGVLQHAVEIVERITTRAVAAAD
ncbi:MAG TPA: hypothetical protein VM032_15155 [Vicinamibacterales bacterium]|nr:hypothetical protein [Vicinamibacterales bacterium]